MNRLAKASWAAAVVVVGVGANLGACTSGGTPDCDGGACGYTASETGAEEGGTPDSSTESSAPDTSVETSAPEASSPDAAPDATESGSGLDGSGAADGGPG